MKTFEMEIKELREKIKNLELDEKVKSERKLPGNCYFLNSETIVSYRAEDGNARYPYAYDGLTLWAYASGVVTIEESIFNVLLPAFEGKEPYLDFFAGIKRENGYFPISMLGAARQPMEKDVKRYTVFTPYAVYYFAETSEITTTIRMLIDDSKLLRISLYIENLAEQALECYLSSYMNFFLQQKSGEGFEDKWYKRCESTDYGYLMRVTENKGRGNCFIHHAAVARSSYDGEVKRTTSRRVYNGGLHNQLTCSIPLFKGEFSEKKEITEFTETAVIGEILPMFLEKGKSVNVSYTCAFFDEQEKSVQAVLADSETQAIDLYIERKKKEEAEKSEEERLLEIRFGDIKSKNINATKLNYFIENVLRQVEFVSRAKNYAGHLIGIRDIFQQVEAALFWIPAYARKKIIEAIGYIGDNGRAPRQYSYPRAENVLPEMDLREFIDQGVWIISTIYTYLTFTNDYSILNEECGYYKIQGRKVDFSDKKDSVLEHLFKIIEYLSSNLAEDTGCLRVLYGDWNDALDGLGASMSNDNDFGNGISVMATLQLYRNLNEMIEILKKIGSYAEKIAIYEDRKERIRAGLQTHAIVENEKGERKIVHGWGDKIAFKICSFADNDGEDRDGLTSNAFWILSGAIDWDRTLTKDILRSYRKLDSKYGLKTFEPYFSENNTQVGRIIKLPKGTAENGATYIHATLFGILSLFEIGESKLAWEQIYKILPLTHDYISTTPFIMSNSYGYNEEIGLDGASMSDWFTGSGCVLIKALVWEIFGIRPNLDGLEIKPANYFPMEKASIRLRVKNCNLTIKYENGNSGVRQFRVNDEKRTSVYDEKIQTQTIYLADAELLKDDIIIEVFD